MCSLSFRHGWIQGFEGCFWDSVSVLSSSQAASPFMVAKIPQTSIGFYVTSHPMSRKVHFSILPVLLPKICSPSSLSGTAMDCVCSSVLISAYWFLQLKTTHSL